MRDVGLMRGTQLSSPKKPHKAKTLKKRPFGRFLLVLALCETVVELSQQTDLFLRLVCGPRR